MVSAKKKVKRGDVVESEKFFTLGGLSFRREHLVETGVTAESQLCEDLGEGCQAVRIAGTKGLRPNELDVFPEHHEG